MPGNMPVDEPPPQLQQSKTSPGNNNNNNNNGAHHEIQRVDVFKALPPIFNTLTPNIVKAAVNSLRGDALGPAEASASVFGGGSDVPAEGEMPWTLPPDVSDTSSRRLVTPAQAAGAPAASSSGTLAAKGLLVARALAKDSTTNGARKDPNGFGGILHTATTNVPDAVDEEKGPKVTARPPQSTMPTTPSLRALLSPNKSNGNKVEGGGSSSVAASQADGRAGGPRANAELGRAVRTMKELDDQIRKLATERIQQVW